MPGFSPVAAESELEMAQRHLREGTERLLRQREILAGLEQRHPSQAAGARDLLAVYEDTVALARAHLAALQQPRRPRRWGPAD